MSKRIAAPAKAIDFAQVKADLDAMEATADTFTVSTINNHTVVFDGERYFVDSWPCSSKAGAYRMIVSTT